MARYIFNGKYVDQSGRIVLGGTVSAFLAGTSTAASIYSTETGETAANSVTTGSDGSYTFYIDDFDYDTDQKFDITLSKSGYTSKTYHDVAGTAILKTYTISEATTINSYVKSPKGVLYSKSGSGSLAFNGGFEAGAYQVFSGFSAGNVTGLKETWSEWWGFSASASATVNVAASQSAAYALTSGGNMKFVSVGTAQINDKITLLDYTTVDGNDMALKIQQTTAEKQTFYASGKTGIKIRNIYLYGQGGYSGTWSGNDHYDRGVDFSTCTDCEVSDSRFENFAFAAIADSNGTNPRFINNLIEGTHTHGVPIVTGNSYQFGIVLFGTTTGGKIDSNDISGTAHGMSSQNVVGTTFPGNTLHDITGQHGFYLSGDAFSITGGSICNVVYSSIKISSTGASNICNSASITGIAISNTTVTNVAFTLSASGGGAINNLTISNCPSYKKGGYLTADGTGGTINGLTILGAQGDELIGYGIYLVTVSNAIIDDFKLRSVGSTFDGIRTAGTSNVKVRSGFIIDFGRYGVIPDSGTGFEMEGVRISDSTATMTYAFYNHGDTDVRLYNNDLLNGVTAAYRFDVAPTVTRGNTGYVSENSGTSAAIATGGTIAHGLSGTPATVLITAAEAGPTDITASANATNITVNFGGGGNKTFYWRAMLSTSK